MKDSERNPHGKVDVVTGLIFMVTVFVIIWLALGKGSFR